MLGFLQEEDEAGYQRGLKRFLYSASYQHRFNCPEQNLVLDYFHRIRESNPRLMMLPARDWSSRIFVSHDIDILFKSIYPELKTAIKHLDAGAVMTLLIREFWKDPDRKLFERILSINDTYDVESTFFWMVENRGFNAPDGQFYENANYSIKGRAASSNLKYLIEKDQTIGIHKSLGSEGLSSECKKLPIAPIANRNHYLHGRIQDIIMECANEQIALECSAGFSEKMGFRNSYGAPYRPFHLSEKKMVNSIVVPLHIMDATFMKDGKSGRQATEDIISFISDHREGCVLSILWHNNYFSDIKYREWLNAYKEILHFCWENQITGITPEEIINDFQ